MEPTLNLASDSGTDGKECRKEDAEVDGQACQGDTETPQVGHIGEIARGDAEGHTVGKGVQSFPRGCRL